jgi:outer membrane protein TolC
MNNWCIFFILNFYCCYNLYAQDRTLEYFINQGITNNSGIIENNNLQQYNALQNSINIAQYRKPQISITADYLFAPYFFNNGQFISITPHPEKGAYGYDSGITNGGLYSALLNATFPLISGNAAANSNKQNIIQGNQLKNTNKQLVHDLEKSITDQYIGVYQLQQQLIHQQNIIALIEERKQVVSALVQKGLMQQSDYLLLEIDIKQLQYDIQQQKISIVNLYNQLNSLCSIKDTVLHDLAVPSIVQSPPQSHFNYQQKYENDSAGIIAQQRVFNTRYKLQLSAFANMGLNATDASTIPHNFGTSAGLHLAVPIYDGGQKKLVEHQNFLLLDNLQHYQNQTILQQSNQLSMLQKQIDLTQQSFALIDSQLSSQDTLLNMIKDKVLNGQVSVTDYLNAIRDFTTANQKKLQAQTNFWLLINQYNYINW